MNNISIAQPVGMRRLVCTLAVRKPQIEVFLRFGPTEPRSFATCIGRDVYLNKEFMGKCVVMYIFYEDNRIYMKRFLDVTSFIHV